MDSKRKNIYKILLMLVAGGGWFFLNVEGALGESGCDDFNVLVSWLFVITWIAFLIKNRTNLAVLITSACISTYQIIAIPLYLEYYTGWGTLSRIALRMSVPAQVWFCGLDQENYFIGNRTGMYPGLLVSIVLTLLAIVFMLGLFFEYYELQLPERFKLVNIKKKKWIVAGVVVVACAVLLLCTHNSDRKTAMQLLGIDINDYQVVSIDDKLSKSKYEGHYEVILKVEETQMDMISDVISDDDYEIFYSPHNMYEDYEIKNIERRIGRFLNEEAVIYSSYDNEKRTLLFKDKPDYTNTYIIISELKNGYYEVIFRYTEDEK